MALGDGIRRNIAHVSQAERDRFRDAIVQLHSRYYPDGVSKWVKQDQIHEATHVHGGSSFLPWHRELVNRFEALLREVDPDLSMHYWDWTQDPRAADDGSGGTVNLFTTDFMGTDSGAVGAPFASFPTITRSMASGAPGVDSDAEILSSTDGVPQADQWQVVREKIEDSPNHDSVHGYIGGTIGNPHTAFEDPFVFLLHSNVDRLFAMWQVQPGEEWRLDPEQVYGNESSSTAITENLEPWAGVSGLRPWAPPDNQQEVKNSKHVSVVAPPCYDTMPTHTPLLEPVNPGNIINFNGVPEGETTARAATFRIYGCRDVTLQVKAGTEPTAPFTILSPGGSAVVGHEPGLLEGRLWFGFTGQTAGSTTPSQTVTIEAEGREFDFELRGDSIAREEVALMLALDQSGSMDDPAGTTGNTRMQLLKEAATELVNLVQPNNGFGLVRFDHDAYPVGDATYPGFPVTRITTDSDLDPDRIAARNAVAAHATNPLGATSIGDGVQLARNTVNPVSGYDYKSLIVFTDGLENRDLYIADVLGSIDNRTFAIGLGNSSQVSTAALNTLTAGTGGYLLLTDTLTASLDDYFLLRKYFLQILASATNTDIIVDPNGYLAPGTTLRLPFDLDDGDIICTPILLHELPVTRFLLESPAGELVDPSGFTGTFNETQRMSNYRFALPTAVGGKPAHSGRWHAVIDIDKERWEKYVRERDAQGGPASHLATHGIRYSFNVHTYSNLRMAASIVQTSLEPGSALTVRALLTEYGIPVEQRARVHCDLRLPDGTSVRVDLSETQPGVFEGTVHAPLPGVYRGSVYAAGLTLKGNYFTREQVVSAATVKGGDGPLPTGESPDNQAERICELLECYVRSRGLWGLFLNKRKLLDCIRRVCQRRKKVVG